MQLIPGPLLFIPLHEEEKTRPGYEAGGTVGLDNYAQESNKGT